MGAADAGPAIMSNAARDFKDSLWCPRCIVPVVYCGACGTAGPWVRYEDIAPEDRQRFFRAAGFMDIIDIPGVGVVGHSEKKDGG